MTDSVRLLAGLSVLVVGFPLAILVCAALAARASKDQ